MCKARLLVVKWLVGVGISVLLQDAVATECDQLGGCEAKRVWVEAFNLGGGGGGGASFLTAGLDLNAPYKEHAIALGYRNLSQNYLSSRYDRDNGLPIEGRLKVISASRLWHWPSRLGYVSSSIGLSVLSGEVGKHCEQMSSFLYPRYSCKSKTVSTVGIPLRLSAGFGRYIGIAAHLELNLNTEASYILSTISLPIGRFAR